MNWKYVFNAAHRTGWHRDGAAKAACEAGYKFMAHNNVIYFLVNAINSSGDIGKYDTGLEVNENGDIQ